MIRRARASDSETLSKIAYTSKAHWGYSPAFMEACREELTISPEYIADSHVCVLVWRGDVSGFYSLERVSQSRVELGHLFVSPDRIGDGCGRALLYHAITEAKGLGFRTLVIQADPNAEEFYEACGASTVATRASASIPDRVLPLMEVRV
jgi:GNAT superfamily N-acetyltransferase